jgi:hypothetical protein
MGKLVKAGIKCFKPFEPFNSTGSRALELPGATVERLLAFDDVVASRVDDVTLDECAHDESVTVYDHRLITVRSPVLSDKKVLPRVFFFGHAEDSISPEGPLVAHGGCVGADSTVDCLHAASFQGTRMSRAEPSWDGLLDRLDPEEFAALKARSIAEGARRAKRRKLIYTLLAGVCLAIVLDAVGLRGWQWLAAIVGAVAIGELLELRQRDLQEQIFELDTNLRRLENKISGQ